MDIDLFATAILVNTLEQLYGNRYYDLPHLILEMCSRCMQYLGLGVYSWCCVTHT